MYNFSGKESAQMPGQKHSTVAVSCDGWSTPLEAAVNSVQNPEGLPPKGE
jgi:hypothetical protein